MKNPLISVIVPVYKAENYIHKCVDSLLSQSFKDFEVILVDDGSPDNSGKICDEYALMDDRVNVIHKNNGGVSSARQCGLDNAIGDYIIHADPDDWVEPDMLEGLYSKALEDDSDMVICDYFMNKGEEQIYVEQNMPVNDPESLIKGFLSGTIHGSCWNKLIKRICFIDNNITFPKEFNLCEDLYVNTLVASKIKKIAYLPKAYYHYAIGINSNSYTGNISPTKITDRYRMIMALDKELIRNDEIDLLLSKLKLRICSDVIVYQVNLDRVALYKSCKNAFSIICKLDNIRFYRKFLLLADYKQLNLIVKLLTNIMSYLKKYVFFR